MSFPGRGSGKFGPRFVISYARRRPCNIRVDQLASRRPRHKLAVKRLVVADPANLRVFRPHAGREVCRPLLMSVASDTDEVASNERVPGGLCTGAVLSDTLGPPGRNL